MVSNVVIFVTIVFRLIVRCLEVGFWLRMFVFLDFSGNYALRIPKQPDYKANVYKLYGLINSGVNSRGSAMRFARLKSKYPMEYGEMRAERMGQEEVF